jgi:bifunctional polynucleotide phosphatase/kinase
MTGMFDLVNNLYKSKGYEVDMEKSVYVGDAAGRLAGVGRRKDHGDTDYKLALNVGLKFVTPEVCLLIHYPYIFSSFILKIFDWS